jgi:K+-sensing histidine kinase KdpD
MRQTAHTVESRHWADQVLLTEAALKKPQTERSGCCLLIDPTPASTALIRRGRRVADYLGADCTAVYVSKTAGLDLLDEERDSVQRHFNFARGAYRHDDS